MKNNKGQSLIDVIFSIGIVVLVLTGIVVLVVSTAKVKRMAFERQKAVELSQLLIEGKILETKNNVFWSETTPYRVDFGSTNPNFSDYTYDVGYSGCNNIQTCNIIFTVRWGDSQKLSVERLFSRQGI
jgi:hypothetical protein